MYIVCKCSNIDDINDLVQETYVELYKILNKKEYIVIENPQNYIIGIAKKKIQKHYGILYKLNTMSIYNNENDLEHEQDIPDNIDIEAEISEKLNAEKVWEFIKTKNIETFRVFYLYFYSDLKLSQIAEELNISESNVKNLLYRTIKEIKNNAKIEGDANV